MPSLTRSFTESGVYSAPLNLYDTAFGPGLLTLSVAAEMLLPKKEVHIGRKFDNDETGESGNWGEPLEMVTEVEGDEDEDD